MNKQLAWQSTLLRVLEPIVPIITVDVGARNGPLDVRRIAPVSSIYCFEPNVTEFNKLKDTGAELLDIPTCGEMRRFPAAVCATSGTVTLNISRRPGATSTLEPNRELLAQFAVDHWSELVDIVERVEVPAVTLPEFSQAAKLSHIDFLKLDTQGNELDILRSAGDLLDRVGVVKTEVEFLPMYEGQALFDEVGGYLRTRGFELVDIEIVPACRRFHRFERLPPSAYRLVWADLVMVRRPFANDPRALAKAAVLAAMGYADIACHIVQLAHGDDLVLCKAFEVMALDMLKPRTWASRIRSALERKFGVLISRYDWRRGHQVNSVR